MKIAAVRQGSSPRSRRSDERRRCLDRRVSDTKAVVTAETAVGAAGGSVRLAAEPEDESQPAAANSTMISNPFGSRRRTSIDTLDAAAGVRVPACSRANEIDDQSTSSKLSRRSRVTDEALT